MPPPLADAAAGVAAGAASRSCSGCRRRRGRRGSPTGRRGRPGLADAGDRGADRHRLPRRHEDLQQHAVVRAGDLRVDLVGRHLEQRIVERDRVADLLEPVADRALGDGLPELGHGDVVHLAARARRIRRGRGPGHGRPRRRGGWSRFGTTRGGSGGVRGRRAARARGGPGLADPHQRRADRDRLARRHEDLQDHAVVRAGDLRVDLVRGHLEQRVVERDGVADLLEPVADHALGHRLAQLGHGDGPRFSASVPLPASSLSRAGNGRRK